MTGTFTIEKNVRLLVGVRVSFISPLFHDFSMRFVRHAKNLCHFFVRCHQTRNVVLLPLFYSKRETHEALTTLHL